MQNTWIRRRLGDVGIVFAILATVGILFPLVASAYGAGAGSGGAGSSWPMQVKLEGFKYSRPEAAQLPELDLVNDGPFSGALAIRFLVHRVG